MRGWGRWMGACMRTSIHIINIIRMAGSTYDAKLRSAQHTYVAKTYYECVSRITWEGMRRCNRWQRVHKDGSSCTNGKGGGEGEGEGEGKGDVIHVLATRRQNTITPQPWV